MRCSAPASRYGALEALSEVPIEAMGCEHVARWLSEQGLESSPERLDLLRAFEEALYEANRSTNLTRVPRDEFWLRHVVDSLLFQDLISAGAAVLDIGAGAGFPSWPLAWARPDLSVTALDSSGKAVRFLESVPLPNLRVEHARAEEWGVREEFDVVTGRALAPLSAQVELSAAPCRIGGAILPMRTLADREACGSIPAQRLGLRLESVHERELPETGAKRVFPLFRKVRPTSKRFPRQWAQIRREPL